jgi:hypothetical protein
MSQLNIFQVALEVMTPFSESVTTTGMQTMRIGTGNGSQYYAVSPVVDSGDELRSKVYKAFRATGKLTNAEVQVYTYDVSDPIVVSDLDDGTNSTTGSISLPDTTNVAQSPRVQINCPNTVLGTIRIAGDDRGESVPDRIDEISLEVASQGVRR